MKPAIAAAAVLIALVVPSAASAHCHSARLSAGADNPALWQVGCSGNMIPHVSVNGHRLFIVDASDHAKTATFYGHRSVIRFHEGRRHVSVRVETVARLEGVRVWFTRLHNRLVVPIPTASNSPRRSVPANAKHAERPPSARQAKRSAANRCRR